jgi:4'-phosphopantetheinyl transferase
MKSPASGAPPGPLRLADDEVHVWWACLDLPAAALAQLAQTLDPGEHARAERFYFEEDRRRFVASHGALRTVLGSYLAAPPEQVAFGYDAHGKPFVIQAADIIPLRFNLSHSHEMALMGVARGRQIGVDVERIRPALADEQMARRFFSPPEVEALLSFPAEQQAGAFFRCWTRKEAYLKARGDGLSFPLDQFDVSLSAEEPALLSVGGDRLAAARWRLADPGEFPGYAAALAAEGHGWRLRRFDFNP